jgi:hypothetical protein
MKHFIAMGALALTTINTHAQDLNTVLDKTFTAFDTTWDAPRQVELSNKLSLIAKKWDTSWLAHYYLSYSRITLSYQEKDNNKKDAYIDEAEKEREDAVAILKKENDETYVLAAMIANARLGVDPMQRWMKYGPIFKQNLESAKEINPDNPRMYYLQGTSTFFTPKAYGGGKKNAKPYFEKAEELFAKETGKDITMPHWGKHNNEYFLNQCNAEDKDN